MNVTLILALLLVVGANISNMVVAIRVRDKDLLASNLAWLASAGTALAALLLIYAIYAHNM